MDGQSDLFSQLFVNCKETGKNTCDLELEILVDRLLKLDFGKRIFAITNKIAGEVLCHLADSTSLFLTKNEYLLHKFFQLAVHLTSSQEIILEEDEANLLLSKMIEVWKKCLNNSTSLQSLLDAVAAVSYLNGPYISSENMTFMLQNGEDGLYAIAKNNSLDKDLRKVAVQCLSGLCSPSASGDQISNERMSTCLKFFISILQNTSTDLPHDITTCKVVFSPLKGIHVVMSSETRVHLQSIGPLLAVLKKFMLYGVVDVAHSSPHELQPVPIPALHPPSKQQEDEDKTEEASTKQQPQQSKKKRKKAKSKSKFKSGNESNSRAGHQKPMMDQVQLRPSWAKVTSSESDYSDTEGAQRAKLRSFLSKIRNISLSALLLAVKKTDKHTMLGYWSSFLPESGATDDPTTLFKSFKEDPTPKCRATALGVLGALLDGSRRYLAFAAEETGSPSQSTSSFVPFSVSLAASIREIHKQLLIASSKEQSTMALTQLLKTLTNLVFNTPYRKMKPGLLVKVSSQARHFLISTRDNNLKVVALMLLGAVTSTTAPLAEVAHILTDMSQMSSSTPRSFSGPDTPVEFRNVLSESTACAGSSWLIDLCVSFARLGRKISKPTSTQFFDQDQPEVPFAIRSEAISTLAKIAKGYLVVAKDYIGILADLVCQCLQDSISAIQLNAAKLLEELGSGLVQILKSQNSENLQCEALSFWLKVLDGPLQTAMQDNDAPLLQAKGCDCLSTLSPTLFTKLNKNTQMMCISLLIGFSSEDNASVVRSAAVRALGIFVMFPTLREDVVFLEDVSLTVLSILRESPVLIRANAAWTFGNLTDTLVINKEIRPHFVAEFQRSLLRDLFEQAFKSVTDKARVVFNMMRVLGNLIRYADESLVADSTFQPLLLKATHILSDMVSCDAAMVKVRWNACTACCNLLSNDKLPLGNPEWTGHVYDSLCSSVGSCKNFKVRIKAALALSTPRTRDQFGSKYIDVLKCLVQGFEESKMAVDFVEYQFRDTLQEQLCTTLVHTLSLLSRDDIDGLSEILIERSNEIKEQLDHYHNKLTQTIENEKLCNHSSVTESTGGTSDPVEQYILVKLPSTEEKLTKFKTTVENFKEVKAFPSDEGHGGTHKTGKFQSDSVNLYEIVTTLEIND